MTSSIVGIIQTDGSTDRWIRSPTDSPRSASASSPPQSPSQPLTSRSESNELAFETIKSPKPKSPTPLERFWKHARSRTLDEFPPPHWLSPEKGSTNLVNVTIYKDDDKTAVSAPEEREASTSSAVAEDKNGEPSPQTLAHRIQAIISSAPSPFSSSDPSGSGSNVQPRTPTSALSPLADSKLLSFISSPKMMNGSPLRGGSSVWSILERLQSPVQTSARESRLPEDSNTVSETASPNTNGTDFRDYGDDGSSMMICSPLIPQRDSLVELAETEYVSLDELGRIVAHSPLHSVSEEQVLQDPDQELNTEPEPEVQPQLEERLRDEDAQVEVQLPPENQHQQKGFQWPWSTTKDKPKEKRIWVPSTTKISLQTTWWGYRIYLPPPVLQVLNDKQLEAAKRAAIITTALKWLFDNIPDAIIPPQFHLALKLVRSLVPLLGYIGGFIAWSWSAIVRFDHGHGVTLTATWLLPIALVPGTWQSYEVPPPSRDGTPRSPPTDLNGNIDSYLPAVAEQSGSASTSGNTEPSTSQQAESTLLSTNVFHDSGPGSTPPETDYTEDRLMQEQTTQASVYEEPMFNSTDARSVYHEPIPQNWDGMYFQIQQQPQNGGPANMYEPQMQFFPPPVIVQTIPLPASTPPPDSH